MIKSIKLLNFRSHRESYLEFHKGTNLLLGIMGSGKSSILDGICFAFFGTIPSIDRRKIKLEDLIRLNEEFAQIELEFLWEKNEYKIIRKINREKKGVSSEAEIYKNGKLIESGQSATTDFIEKVLEIDYELYTRSIYSEQNNIDHFLSLDPRKRKTEIDTLLGLDKFENARVNLVGLITKVNSQKEELESKADKKKLEESKETMQKLKIEMDENGKKEAVETVELEKMKIENRNKENRLNDLLKTQQERQKIEKEMGEIEYFIKNNQKIEIEFDQTRLDQKLEKKKNIQIKKSEKTLENKRIDQELLRLNSELSLENNKKKNQTELNEKITKSSKELEELLLGLDKKTIQNQIEKNNNEANDFEAKIKSNEIEIRENQDLMSKIKKGMENCPLCKTKIDEKCIHEIKDEKNKLNLEKTQENILLKERIKTLKTDLIKQIERLKKIESIEQKLEILKLDAKDILIIEEKILNITKTKQDFQNIKDKIGFEIEEILKEEKENEIEIFKLNKSKETQIKLEESKARSIELGKKLSIVENPKDEIEKMREEIGQMRVNIEKITGELKRIQEVQKYQKQNLLLLQKIVEEEIQREEKIRQIVKMEQELNIFKNALIETQTSLRNSMIDAINMAVSEVWQIIYPYKNYQSIRLDATEKDYVFQVDDGRGFRSIESIASGGERASGALALRIAFAMVLTPKLGWMILDEPTHNLDRDAVELLSNTLQFKIPQIVNQTFVITHDESLMGSDFASSYRLNRDKNTNGETQIQRI